MTRINWRDPEHRRDALIVTGLFALGVALNVAIGVIVIWLLQALGLWTWPLPGNWTWANRTEESSRADSPVQRRGATSLRARQSAHD